MSGLSRRNDTCKAYFRTTYGLRPRCAPSPRQNHPSVSTVPGSRLADSTNAVGLCDENNARLRRTDPRLYSCRVHTAPPVNCSLVRQPCLSTTSFPCDCRALTVLRGIRIHNEGTPPRSNPKRSETSSAWDASPSEEPIQAPERSRSGIASLFRQTIAPREKTRRAGTVQRFPPFLLTHRPPSSIERATPQVLRAGTPSSRRAARPQTDSRAASGRGR